jgi:IS1 family transposase
MDEQWSFVGNKSNQRWIWYAVEHSTNTILASIFGKRKEVVFKALQDLLKPFNIKRYYTDDWRAYERNIPTNEHEIGKKNTQKIERKNLCTGQKIQIPCKSLICNESRILSFSINQTLIVFCPVQRKKPSLLL